MHSDTVPPKILKRYLTRNGKTVEIVKQSGNWNFNYYGSNGDRYNNYGVSYTNRDFDLIKSLDSF